MKLKILKQIDYTKFTKEELNRYYLNGFISYELYEQMVENPNENEYYDVRNSKKLSNRLEKIVSKTNFSDFSKAKDTYNHFKQYPMWYINDLRNVSDKVSDKPSDKNCEIPYLLLKDKLNYIIEKDLLKFQELQVFNILSCVSESNEYISVNSRTSTFTTTYKLEIENYGIIEISKSEINQI